MYILWKPRQLVQEMYTCLTKKSEWMMQDIAEMLPDFKELRKIYANLD
jgi:hypothetical protein